MTADAVTTNSTVVAQWESRTTASATRPAASNPCRASIPSARMVSAVGMAAGMGMEILWLRHFTVLLGGFRAVFSLLLTIVPILSKELPLLNEQLPLLVVGGFLPQRLRRALRDLVHAPYQFVHPRQIAGADRIAHAGMGLHHIGRDAAGDVVHAFKGVLA